MKPLIFLLLLTTNIHAMTFLEALSMQESGDNDRAVRKAGEVSRYQIKPATWHQYSKSIAYSNPGVADIVARRHITALKSEFYLATGRFPTEEDIICMWRLGFTGYKRHGFTCPPFLKQSVEEFNNLRKVTK